MRTEFYRKADIRYLFKRNFQFLKKSLHRYHVPYLNDPGARVMPTLKSLVVVVVVVTIVYYLVSNVTIVYYHVTNVTIGYDHLSNGTIALVNITSPPIVIVTSPMVIIN